MLSLIIAEAALETIPKSIEKHTSIMKHAARKDKPVRDILLDRSYHHGAMLKLDDGGKRGRPDLVHFALLEAMSTPLYQKGMLAVYVHTIANKVISFHTNVRLPKTYLRFEGLMENLFKNKQVRSNDEVLIEVKDMQFAELLNAIRPSTVIGLSRTGVKSDAEEVANRANDESAIVVGGFPRGHFSSKVYNKLDRVYSISSYGLEAHVVIARVLYEYEKRVKIEER